MSEYNIQMNKYNALSNEYDKLYPQPMKHASTHAKNGSDPILPSSIGAYSKEETDTLLANNFSTLLGLLTKQTTFVESFQGDETCDTAPMGIRKTMSTTGFPSNFGEWALIMTYYYDAGKAYGWQLAYDMNGYQIAYRYRRNSSWFDWKYISTTDHTQSASTITEGIFAGKIVANSTARAVLTDYQLRDIMADSSDLTAGSTALPSGVVYLVYE